MNKRKEKTILPPQYSGDKTGAVAHVEEKSQSDALKKFYVAKEKLLDINNWHQYAHIKLTHFKLVDVGGNVVNRQPEIGDFIRIDLPGPGPTSGEGYDWVCIEQFDEKHDMEADTDFFAFRVRPANAPNATMGTPSHFYTDETTSTFIIQRVGCKITACEKGRNEIPNTNTESSIDNFRNAIVAKTAAAGFAIPQWKALMEGIIE